MGRSLLHFAGKRIEAYSEPNRWKIQRKVDGEKCLYKKSPCFFTNFFFGAFGVALVAFGVAFVALCVAVKRRRVSWRNLGETNPWGAGDVPVLIKITKDRNIAKSTFFCLLCRKGTGYDQNMFPLFFRPLFGFFFCFLFSLVPFYQTKKREKDSAFFFFLSVPSNP